MTESEEHLGLNVQVATQLGVPHVALSRMAVRRSLRNGSASRKQASRETRRPWRCVGSTVGVW